MLRLATTALLAAVLLPQGKWQEIGTTSTGNPVFVDPGSVKHGAGGIITAKLRVVYTTPLDTPKGKVTSSRAVAMFDCAGNKVATKESVLYLDEKKGLEYSRRTIAQPGFGPALSSTYADIALKHLCKK